MSPKAKNFNTYSQCFWANNNKNNNINNGCCLLRIVTVPRALQGRLTPSSHPQQYTLSEPLYE